MDGSEHQYPRHVTSAVREALADTPVVCITGPRQCGKTTLVETAFPDRSYFSFDDDNYLATARLDPSGFIDALPPEATLDEIQRVPGLLPAIKRSVDRERRPGRFLLTGSANLLLLPRLAESLAGRMEVIELQPLTEAEKERSAGRFLSHFVNGQLKPELHGRAEAASHGLAERLVAGGYPEPLTRSAARARHWHRQYVKSIIQRDVRDVARIRDADSVARLLELLALRTSGMLNISALSQEFGHSRQTVEHYLTALEKLYLVRRLPAWHRSAARRLVKTPKLHLLDCGLAATLAGLTEVDWRDRRDAMGRLLESFVVQQVIAQAAWTDADLRCWHYRDKDKVEVDLVLTRGQDVWGIEVKASQSIKPHDTHGLSRLAAQSGTGFRGGLLLYAGEDTLPLGDAGFLAVPVSKLWSI